MSDLSGRTTVVDGASRGLGRGIARAFAEAGATPALDSQLVPLPPVPPTISTRKPRAGQPPFAPATQAPAARAAKPEISPPSAGFQPPAPGATVRAAAMFTPASMSRSRRRAAGREARRIEAAARRAVLDAKRAEIAAERAERRAATYPAAGR